MIKKVKGVNSTHGNSKYYLSIDTGGTISEFLLTNENGVKLGSAILGSGNYIVEGLDHVIDILNKGIYEVTQAAGIALSEISSCFLAMAGYGDIPEETESIKARIRREIAIPSLFIGNDSENAIAGSLIGKSGIHIISGTGSIALGIDLNQNSIRCGGWHHIFGGDEGGAYWMACKLILHFTHQTDGREEKTELYHHIMRKYYLTSPEQILPLIIEEWGGNRAKIAQMSRDVYELALKGEPIALEIFDQAAYELARMVKAIKAKGEFMEPTMVSYSGGVFTVEKFLVEPLKRYLHEFGCELVPPVLAPLAGGIFLAMSMIGDLPSESMIQHLKEN